MFIVLCLSNPLLHWRDHAELLHQAEKIELTPGFHDLATGKAINIDRCHSCLFTGGRNAVKPAQVRAARRQAMYYRIPFGDLIFKCEVDVGKGCVKHTDKLLDRISYLRALAVLAQNQGKVDTAIGHLQEAAKLAEEIGLPGELWLLAAAQGELYLKRGEKTQAYSAFNQAVTIVQQLANTIDDDGQRTHFLTSPIIGRVLEQAS